jgi:hypothetical protein
MSPLTQLGPRSVQFNSTPAGVCERHDEHTGHVTAVQMLTDVDGQTFIDDASLTVITIQDVAGWTSMGYRWAMEEDQARGLQLAQRS